MTTQAEQPDAATAGRTGARARSGQAGRRDWSTWPEYEAAANGFAGYWYPVMFSRDLGDKPQAVKLMGEQIVVVRHDGKPYGLVDRCPHRGVPLSYGTVEMPGTVSCRYHGWSYDLESGNMCAAITDGPGSPINNKESVGVYPADERLGLVWIYMAAGDEQTPPIERDIPRELLENKVTVGGKIEAGRPGNWRLAAENGFDEGHAKYLHRDALYYLFKSMPVWTETHVVGPNEQGWLLRVQDAVHWDYTDPEVGNYTVDRWWRKRIGDRPANDPGKALDPVIAALGLEGRTSIRMPGQLRVAFRSWVHYEFYVPEDADHHRYVQIAVSFDSGWGAVKWAAHYAALVRPLFHGQFTGQDTWMVHVMDAPPERLYRPDVSITAWRRQAQMSGAKPHVPRPTKLVRRSDPDRQS